MFEILLDLDPQNYKGFWESVEKCVVSSDESKQEKEGLFILIKCCFCVQRREEVIDAKSNT